MSYKKNFLTNNIFLNSKYSNNNLHNHNYKEGIIYSEDFNNMGIDESFNVGEVFISRVRFKPGYQRM